MSSNKEKKKTAKKAGISWITVWLIVVAFIFAGIVGYASYTGVTMVKRVVSTKAGAGLLFSSNYMTTSEQTTLEYNDYDLFLDEQGQPTSANPTYNMLVCNFAQGDRSTWYTSKNIDYTVTAKLYLNEKYVSTDAEALENPELVGTYKVPTQADVAGKVFGIKFGSGDDGTYEYFNSTNSFTINLPDSGSYSLSKQEASTDFFSLVFDKSELRNNAPKFWIYVVATPTQNTGAGGEVEAIKGYVGTCQAAKGGATWYGEISDESKSTIDYDAYNYIITGNGKGDFYFAWDDSKVKPNEFAFLNYNSYISVNSTNVENWSGYTQYGETPPATGSWKYIVLDVNSDVVTRFEFQLYKTSGDDYSSLIDTYVDYKFIPDQE